MGIDLHAHVSGLDLGIIAAYLLLMIAIGVYVARRLVDAEGFLVAGRAMTTPMLVCTLVSTYYGVDVLFGTSELSYTSGVVAWFAYSRPAYLLLLVAALVLPQRLRAAEFRTLPEVLGRTYGPATQAVGALASFLYSLPALGLFGLGRAFQVVFGWEPWVGALLFGSLALLYTLSGGLLADVLTDTIQFFMMCVSLAVALPMVMHEVGGFDYVQSALAPGYMTPMGDLPPWLVFVYASTGLVVFIEPAFYQRIFAARSAAAVRNALLFGILLWAAYDWCTTAAGMMAAAAVARGILPEVSPDLALLSVVVYALPAGLTGLFLAGVLAAEMSTIDSYCLVAGGNVAYDFYRPFVRPRASERELLRVARFGVALSWLAGFAVAFLFDRLLALWVFTASLLTSTLLVPMMAALFGRGPKTAASGLLSCTLGLASCLAYYALVQSLGAYDDDLGSYVWRCAIGTRTYDLWQEYALLVSLPVSAAGFWFGSLIGRRRPT